MGAPRESRPSLRQWRSLLDVCAGIFSATTFPVILNQYQRLSGGCVSVVGSKRDMAEALLAVAKLARHELEAINITGTQACSWLATFGHYFLGLSVCIQDSHGRVRYKSGTGGQASITINCPVAILGHSLQLIPTKQYVVRAFEELLMNENRVFTGRVYWEEALSVAFGEDMDVLLGGGQSWFAQILGCTARLMKAMAAADQDLKSALYLDDVELHDLRERWAGYCEDSHGSGFLRSAIGNFPELAGCNDEASLWLSHTVEDASRGYQEAVLELHELCGCNYCPRKSGCLLSLADGVIVLIWTLSLTNFSPDLRPSMSGLRNYVQDDERDCPIPISRLNTLFKRMTMEELTARVPELFSGVEEVEPVHYSAVSLSGVCTFLDSLVQWPDCPGRCKWLRVVPGAIESQTGSRFQSLLDGMGRGGNSPPCKLKVVTAISDALKPAKSDVTIDLVVREALTTLNATFRLHGPERVGPSSEPNGSGREKDIGSFNIGPLTLALLLARSTGTVPCIRSKVCHEEVDLASVVYSEGNGPLRLDDGADLFPVGVPSPVVIRSAVPGSMPAILALCSSNGSSINVDENGLVFGSNACGTLFGDFVCRMCLSIGRMHPMLHQRSSKKKKRPALLHMHNKVTTWNWNSVVASVLTS